MRKIVLYLEEIDLDLGNLEEESVEWVDEESEISLISSHFVDGKLTDEYPSTGRMYVQTSKGNFLVSRLRDLDWDEACKVMEEEAAILRKYRRDNSL